MKQKRSQALKQQSASGWKIFTRTTVFQAKDKDDMMSWIEIIQKNNNPDEDVSTLSEEIVWIKLSGKMSLHLLLVCAGSP